MVFSRHNSRLVLYTYSHACTLCLQWNAADVLTASEEGDAFLAFERAYALFQLGRLPEALAACKRGGGAANVAALEAQVLYKLNRWGEAAASYQALVDADRDDAALEGSELLSNGLAAYAAAGQGARGLEHLGGRAAEYLEDEEGEGGDEDEAKSHEIAYNAACCHLDAGNYAEAATLLKLAERRVEATESDSEDDEGEERMGEEAALVACQRAFALLMAGGPGSAGAAQAMLLCMKVVKHRAGLEASSGAVAANNLAVVRRDRELLDSAKRLRGATSEAAEKKLSPRQLFATRFNKAVLCLHLGKVRPGPARGHAAPKPHTPASARPLFLSDRPATFGDPRLMGHPGGRGPQKRADLCFSCPSVLGPLGQPRWTRPAPRPRPWSRSFPAAPSPTLVRRCEAAC